MMSLRMRNTLDESVSPRMFAIALVLAAMSQAIGQAKEGLPLLHVATEQIDNLVPATFEIEVQRKFKNPFDARECRVDVDFTEPSGVEMSMPAFWLVKSDGTAGWQCRFTPRSAGPHTALVRVTTPEESTQSEIVRFTVAESKAKDAKGFCNLDPKSHYTFRFQNGDYFRGLGTNIGWEPRMEEDAIYTYDHLFPRIAAQGANTVRTWMCPWNLTLEWNKLGLADYDQEAGRRLDEMLALAEDNKLFVILVIGYHGELQTKEDFFPGNARWKENPYNVANGGPCHNPAEFFTNKTARELYKSRLRYLVARIASRPHLLAWEFWNEFDHVQRNASVPGEAIVAWHEEMADYLHEIDPYHHPITTSISMEAPPGLWGNRHLDFIMLHPYGATENFQKLLTEVGKKHHKPVVLGEFSYSWKTPELKMAPQFERELQLGMWRGLMSPTPVLPMTWWWEFHDQRDDWRVFHPVAELSQRMLDLKSSDWKPAKVTALNESIETSGINIGEKWFLWLCNRESLAVAETALRVDGAAPGTYKLQLLDTRTGGLTVLGRVSIDPQNTGCTFPGPPLGPLGDAALILEKDDDGTPAAQ